MLSLPMHTSNCNRFYKGGLHCKDFTEARPIALHCGADVISRLARLMAAAGDSSAQLINPNCVLQVLYSAVSSAVLLLPDIRSQLATRLVELATCLVQLDQPSHR